MTIPEFINEPIIVQARFLPDGAVQPTAFIWRERTRYIADWGRQWDEQATASVALPPGPHRGLETFELRFAGRRVVGAAPAWLRDAARLREHMGVAYHEI